MDKNYHILIGKLDEFIRKYYRNQLIRGGIYALSSLIAFYLLAAVAEYFAHFGTSVRTALFWAYIIINTAILAKFFIIPLAALWKIGKVITHKQAADIIGRHFTNVKDKLINTLQLKELAQESTANRQLIEASINQKIEELKPIPFKTAIDLRKNRKYLKYALVPLAAVLLLLVAAPSVIREPTNRIIRHSTYFEKPAPFTLVIENQELKTIQQEDFLLDVKVIGDQVPENVFIEMENGRFRLQKKSTVSFSHKFKNIITDTKFRLVADKYSSAEYTLKVIPKPIILNFDAEIVYPAYTGKKQETFSNKGDLVVPQGSYVEWSFYTRDTRRINFALNQQEIQLEEPSANTFRIKRRFLSNATYSVKTENEFLRNPDSLNYSISVIQDQYPDIMVEEFTDSVYDKRLYFRGMVKDDYGFKTLRFHVMNTKDSLTASVTDTIRLLTGATEEQFFHFYDLAELRIKPGDEYEYYFEIWDNDGVNGSKMSRSQKMFFRAPSLEEVEEDAEKSNEMIKDGLEDLMKEAARLQKETENLRQQVYNKESLNWQDKKKIEDLLKRHESLSNNIENLKKENIDKSLREQQYKEINEEILRKQQELEKLFSEVFDDEMKKMIEELNKLLEEMDKDKISQMMEKMKMSSEEMEKELDRSLELFKQLEFEKKLDETISKMDKLADEQKKLADESLKKDANNEELLKKQDALNKEFNELSKDLEDLKKKNQELEEPFDMMDTKQKEQDISKDMDESSGSLKSGKNKKASESQSGAAKKMKELSQSLEQMADEMQMEEMAEDINSLRDILENLMEASFRQEDLMNAVNLTKTTDPQYLKRIQEQKVLKDDIKMIEDSLFALSKRQVRIQNIVNKEIDEIERNIQLSLDALDNRNKREAQAKQQFVMTGINNLALLLAESLQQMQNEMNQKSSGNQSCNKPGGSKSSMKGMRQMQEQLNKQMEQMKQGMKPGTKSQGGQMSEQLARMAAQQEALRRELEKYREELNKEGLGNDGEMKKMIEEMEKTETDLVNKRISEETLQRQREILTRLLKSEKAEMEREQEEKRESKEAKVYELSNPNSFLEYKRDKSRELELLKTVPPSLKPFYKNKVNAYFYQFGEE